MVTQDLRPIVEESRLPRELRSFLARNPYISKRKLRRIVEEIIGSEKYIDDFMNRLRSAGYITIADKRDDEEVYVSGYHIERLLNVARDVAISISEKHGFPPDTKLIKVSIMRDPENAYRSGLVIEFVSFGVFINWFTPEEDLAFSGNYDRFREKAFSALDSMALDYIREMREFLANPIDTLFFDYTS